MQLSVGVKEELNHLDRVVFGTGCIFLVMFKGSIPKNDKPTLKEVDYEFAIGELQASIERTNGVGKVDKISTQEEEEIKKKLAA